MITVGIMGDFNPDKLTQGMLNQALDHAAAAMGSTVEITWIPTLSLKSVRDTKKLGEYDGLILAPGGAYCSEEGALNGIRFAREREKAFLGIWGGFQYTLLEYARNAAGLKEAAHQESEPDASEPLIVPVSCAVQRTQGSPALCGELRIEIMPDTLASCIYGKSETQEFFGCNYELNPHYLDKLLDKGLIVSGRGENGAVRIVELTGHRFFLATAFQPHMLSKVENPHVLLLAYLKSAM